MHKSIDTSGDAQILQMMEFASGAFRSSSLVFYWVSETAEMFGFRGRGVPDEFLDRYRTGMHRFDPLVVRRLVKANRRVAWLREEAPPVPEAPLYLDFLDTYDIVDNLEFLFWDNDGPFAGLGVLRHVRTEWPHARGPRFLPQRDRASVCATVFGHRYRGGNVTMEAPLRRPPRRPSPPPGDGGRGAATPTEGTWPQRRQSIKCVLPCPCDCAVSLSMPRLTQPALAVIS